LIAISGLLLLRWGYIGAIFLKGFTMKETTIRSRIDTTTKHEAQILLKRLGLSMSDAIRLFLHQVVLEKGLPFQIKLPENEAAEHDKWFRAQVAAAVEEADKPDAEFAAQEDVSARWAKKRESLSGQKKPGVQ
jgi:DNA-damage-inducible protein J